MRGTPGATVTVGDPGLANTFGDAALDLKTFAGTGTAVYAPDLVLEPAAVAAPTIEPSGKTVRFSFAAVSNGSVAVPLRRSSPPRSR